MAWAPGLNLPFFHRAMEMGEVLDFLALSRRWLTWLKPDDVEPPLRPLTWRIWLALGAVFLFSLMATASIQFSQFGLVGADGHYHVRLAKVVSEQGPLDAFEWTQTSINRDRFMDKEFLFHVLLIPFLGDDLRTGPKILTALLAALLMTLLAWIAWRQGMPLFWLAALLLLAAGTNFNFRMALTRPHLLSVLLAVGTAYLLLRRHGWGLLLLATLFPLCYTAFHLLPLLAVIYGVARLLHGKRFAWRELALVLVGTGLGFLLHPNRANMAYHWYLQNVEVIANAWRLAPLMGVEFLAPSGRMLVWDCGLLLFGTLGAMLLTMLSGVKSSLRSTFFLLLSMGFLVMFLSITRLVEYWVPFTALFLLSTAGDWRDAGHGLGRWLKDYGRLASVVLIGLGMMLVLMSLRGLVLTQQEVAEEKVNERILSYEAGGRFLARHVPARDQVFTCGWDTFVFLFYHAPQAHYLVHLDPTFMLAYDVDLFDLWIRIGEGRQADAIDRVRNDFKARWIFIEHQEGYAKFLEQARRSTQLLPVFEGPQSSVFLYSDAHGVALIAGAIGL